MHIRLGLGLGSRAFLQRSLEERFMFLTLSPSLLLSPRAYSSTSTASISAAFNASSHSSSSSANINPSGNNKKSTSGTVLGLVIQRCGEHLLVQVPREAPVGAEDDGNSKVAAVGFTNNLKNFDNMILCSQAPSFKSLKSSFVVAGDLVEVDVSAGSRDSDGVVRKLLPRKNVLQRPGQGGSEHNLKMKTIAANIDHMIIVVAPKPAVPSMSIDQLIVAAKYLKIDNVSIVCNKSDMEEAKELIEKLEKTYSNLGYPVISYSSVKKAKLSSFLKLRELMMHKVSIFVGQSGVGKSSIINTLIPDAEAAEGELVNRTQLGAHTTSNATLYHLPFDQDEYNCVDNDADNGQRATVSNNLSPPLPTNISSSTIATPSESWLSSMSCLIDSPGIRELGLWHVDPQVIKEGFVEIHEAGKACKFRNCMHDGKSSGCAVTAAVEDSRISSDRYKSYLSIINMKPKR